MLCGQGWHKLSVERGGSSNCQADGWADKVVGKRSSGGRKSEATKGVESFVGGITELKPLHTGLHLARWGKCSGNILSEKGARCKVRLHGKKHLGQEHSRRPTREKIRTRLQE